VPEARLWHHVSVASGGERAPDTAYYEMRNTLEVCARHAPLRGPAGVWRETAMLFVHLLHARLAPKPLANARAVLEGWRDFRAGRLGPRGSHRPAPSRAPVAARTQA
jgi:hypothetical protein